MKESLPRTPGPQILSVGRALPPNHVDQETLTAALSAQWGGQHFNPARLAQVHRATRVGGRHLALPVAEYASLGGFGKRNETWLRVGLELGEAAIWEGLTRAGLAPGDVAHLVNRLGLSPSVKRSPIFGLGCLAGATGLFGDGAAAVVLGGGARPARPGAPRVAATRSVFYPDSEWVMGWDVIDSGFKIVLSAKVPEVVEARVGADVDAFLGAHGLGRADVRHWIAHTGGPKVLEALPNLPLPGQPRSTRRSTT